MSGPELASDPAYGRSRGRLRRLIFEAVRFVGSGLVAFPLGLGVAALCRHVFGWRQEVAVVAAFGTLLCVNFALGRAFVFRSSGPLKWEFGRFLGTALLLRGFESLFSIALLRLAGLPYLISIAVTLCLSSMLKFFVYRTWVFHRRAPAVGGTAPDADRTRP